MKTISLRKSLVMATIFSIISLSIISCNKKDKVSDPIPSNPDTNKLTKSKAIGIWTVGSKSGKLLTNTSGYNTFEFTENGGYILGKSDNTFLTGFYTIDTDKNKITLGAYGVITITKISGTIMNFTLRLTGSSTDIDIFSSKTGSAVTPSNSVDSLCQTWVCVTRYTNGVEQTVLRDAILAGTAKITLVMSSYGTYLAISEITGTGTTYENGSWSWTDGTQTAICAGPAGACSENGVTFVNGDLHFTLVNGAQTIETVYTKAQ